LAPGVTRIALLLTSRPLSFLSFCAIASRIDKVGDKAPCWEGLRRQRSRSRGLCIPEFRELHRERPSFHRW
jgi:hypothetical protein